jgi:hypothetical protein
LTASSSSYGRDINTKITSVGLERFGDGNPFEMVCPYRKRIRRCGSILY